jgi:hypothetical protein
MRIFGGILPVTLAGFPPFFFPLDLVAFVAFELIQTKNAKMDLFDLIRLPQAGATFSQVRRVEMRNSETPGSVVSTSIWCIYINVY